VTRTSSPALPRSFRIATGIVAVEAVVDVGYALYLIIRSAFGHPANRAEGISTGAYLLILGIGVAAVVVGMLRGRRWSRSPAITANLIVVGVGWYTITGADRPVVGVLVMLAGIAAIGILVRPSVYQALEARAQAQATRS
jgi:hypothetical protein